MTGKQFEDLVEQKLIEHGIQYDREGEQNAYGHRASKGKCDFSLRECRLKAVECKTIGKLSNLRLPWPKSKNTPLKTHQFAELRKAGTPHEAGHLILDNSTGTIYWMDMYQLDNIIMNYGMVKSLTGGVLDGLEVNLDDFIGGLNEH